MDSRKLCWKLRNITDQHTNIWIMEKENHSKYYQTLLRKLRITQGQIIKGRKLEWYSESTTIEGDTNFILIDRENLLETSFIEIKEIEDLRTTLEVQFYEEVCWFVVCFVLFISMWFFVRGLLENCSLIWRRRHCRWKAANFDQYSTLMAIEQ